MKKEIKISELLYYVFFLVLFTTRTLGVVEGNAFYSLALVISLLCFGLSYLMTPKDMLVLVSDSLLFLLAGICYYKSGEKGMILFFAMMIGARYIPTERLFKCVLAVSGISYAIMLFLGIFGVISETETILYSSPIGYITRRSISNLQVNVVMTPYLVFMMMTAYIYRNSGKRKILEMSTILFLGLLFLFCFCFAKTALIVGILFLIINLYYTCYCKYDRFSRLLTYAFYTLCSITGIAAPAMFDVSGIQSYSDLLDRYPHVLSWYHRLYIGKYYFINNRIPILGQRLYDPNPDAIVYPLIHQSQLYLLLQYGLIMFFVVNALYYMTIRFFLNSKNGTSLAIIMSYAIIGIAEPLLFNLSFKNISFVLIGIAYFSFISQNVKMRKGVVSALITDHAINLAVPEGLLKGNYAGHINLKARRNSNLLSFISGVAIMMFVAIIARPDLNSCQYISASIFDYIRLIVSSFVFGGLLVRGISYTIWGLNRHNRG